MTFRSPFRPVGTVEIGGAERVIYIGPACRGQDELLPVSVQLMAEDVEAGELALSRILRDLERDPVPVPEPAEATGDLTPFGGA